MNAMRPPRTAYIVYLVGLIPLGLLYERLQAATGGGWLFLGLGIVYALVLRIGGEALEAKLRRSRELDAEPGPHSDA